MAPSHYSEKARWALDLAGIDYREECLAPGLHFRALKKVGGRSCPTVVLPDGAVLPDSTDILKHLHDKHPQLKLWPQDPSQRAQVDAIEEEMDEVLAPRVRNWMYTWGLQSRKAAAQIFDKRLSVPHRVFLFAIAGQLRSMIPRKFKLRRKTEAEHLALVKEVWDKYDALLSDGRRYLVGDHFSAADLALASIGAHVVAAPEFGGMTAPMSDRPEGPRAICEQFRASPTGQHILRLYREHRLPQRAAAA